MNPILIGYAILQTRQHSEQLISADRCTLYCKVSTPDKASLLQYNTKVHNNTSPIYTTGRFAGRLHTLHSLFPSDRPTRPLSVRSLPALSVQWQQRRRIKLIRRPISPGWPKSCPSMVRIQQRTTRRNRSTSMVGVADCWHINNAPIRNNNFLKKYRTQTNNKLWCTYWPSKLNIMITHIKIRCLYRWPMCKLRGGRNPSKSVSAHASSSSHGSPYRIGL